MNAFVLIGLVATFVVTVLVLQYNRLVGMRQLVRNAWSDVDVYLKRRAELIPNLVAAVKGYADHESATLERIIRARDEAIEARGVADRGAAETALSAGVGRLIALGEAYPELRASDNFLSLQSDLADTEKLIASARQYFNACVRDYNTLIEAFPSNLVAGPLGFQPSEFFQLDTASERDHPGVHGLP